MRGKGEGSIYRRSSDKRWVGQVELPRGLDGRRRRSRVVRNRRADVVAALDELRQQVRNTGGEIPDRETRLGSYLDYWLEDVVGATDVTPSTLAEYGKRVNRIKPVIGNVRLAGLTTPHVRRLAAQLSENYAPKTARTTLETLRAALRSAEGDGLIIKNPATTVKVPRTKTAKVDDSLTADEADAILAAARGDELEALIWLALKYGLRLGELLNLRWDDIDIDDEVMRVRKSKTDAGVRDLPLIPEAVDQLRRHRERSRGNDLVFVRPDKRRYSPQLTRQRWSKILESAGIEHRCRACGTDKPCSTAVRRFHASRHTAATLLLQSGVQLEVVSAILGHSSITVTADIYSKVRSDLKRKALMKPSALNHLEVDAKDEHTSAGL